jgi:thiol-disulfide isomerase/thioredoxin
VPACGSVVTCDAERAHTLERKILATAILLDLFTSLVTTGLFVVWEIYSFAWRGLGTSVVAAALLFAAAGFLRGNSVPASSLLKALLLTSAFVIFYGFIRPMPQFMLATLPLTVYASSLAATHARRNWTVGARSRSLFILGATLGVVEIASSIGAPILVERIFTWRVNFPAPEFSAMRLNGRSVESRQLKGRVAVLYFWATWCPICWQEFPKLEKLYQRYESNSEVVFLAIDADGNGEGPEVASAFIRQGAYRIPAAFDDRRATARFRLGMYPTLMLLDKSWHVRLVHAGYDGTERYVKNLSGQIDRLLKE